VFLASLLYVAIKRMHLDTVRFYCDSNVNQRGITFLELKLMRFICLFYLQSNYPILARLYKSYEEIPAFQAALPENQPDVPPSS
jgi:maleylacetoacetate isomerase